jgi:hypothetical protein
MLTRRANDRTHRFRPIAATSLSFRSKSERREILEQLIDYPAIVV